MSLAVEGDQSQTVIKHGGELSWKLTLWLRSGLASDRGAQGIDGDSADSEEGKNSFGKHDDMECLEEERITTAPGLKFGR